ANRVIIRSKCCDGSDRNGFFADIEMKESGDLCEGIHFRRFFFESADQEHLAVEGEEVSSVHARYYAWLLRADSTLMFGDQRSTLTSVPSTFTWYCTTCAAGLFTHPPVVTSYCQPCHGQVTTCPTRSPSPRGPPR